MAIPTLHRLGGYQRAVLLRKCVTDVIAGKPTEIYIYSHKP
jgi:hypothetical protein